jgi:hypothetical protein
MLSHNFLKSEHFSVSRRDLGPGHFLYGFGEVFGRFGGFVRAACAFAIFGHSWYFGHFLSVTCIYGF